MKKVIVIGGGASGMVAAIVAARGGADVIILERNNNNGKKILVTGNGKCNYFNDDFTSKHYYTNSNIDLSLLINDKNKDKVLEFFDSIGVVPMIRDGYYYPYSNQAVSILNSLLIEINKLNIKIINNFMVEDIIKNNNGYKIIGNDREYICDKVILASGSYSYYKYDVINSYDMASKLGLNIVKPMPALVQLVVNNSITKKWAGVRVNGIVRLYEDDKFIKEELGEVNFTDYGVSGICIMQFSNIIARGLLENHKYKIKINFVPSIADNILDMVSFLDKYDNNCSGRKVIEILDNIINYKLGNVIFDKYKDMYYKDLSDEMKKDIALNLISYSIDIDSTKGYRESQVCSGGVSLDDINILTMESTNNPGLYIVGELLDITGDCGGYNLGLAWITGIIAGMSCMGEEND